MLSGTSISSNSVVALPQLRVPAALRCALTLRGGRGLQRGADRAGFVPRNARLRAAQLRRRGRTADWLPFPEIWLRCRRWCSAVAAGGLAPHSSPLRARTAVPLSRLRRAHLMPSRAVAPGWCTPLADLREPLRPSSPLMSTTALALCLPAEIEATVCGGRVNMPSDGYLKTVPLGNASSALSADSLRRPHETTTA